MAGGDTLIVLNGVYSSSESTDTIRNVPNGNAGPDGRAGTADDVYTTIKAQTDFGVLIDGRKWSVGYKGAINLYGNSYIRIQGFRVFYGGPIQITSSHHIKIIRNGFGYALTNGNTATAATGEGTEYVLFEENYAFGGARYQFLTYHGLRNVFRRNVARNDYWNDSWQAAAFTNYDSTFTGWQNNIAIDSNMSCCPGHASLFSGFYNENYTDFADDTSEDFSGNIVLNYGARYAANFDWVASGTRTLTDEIYWGGVTGYYARQGSGVAATAQVRNVTIGLMKRANEGIGVGVDFGTISNSMRNSIIAHNAIGAVQRTNSNYNAYFANLLNFSGSPIAVAGANDLLNQAIVGTNLKYLPRGPEAGSPLATAGEGGGRVGAQVMWKIGLDGTLWGEPGWNLVRSPENGYGRPEDLLWPWPNEDIIKSDFAAYPGPSSLPGARGFAAPGNGLYGGPKTLTSYIWEYLGYGCPIDICRGKPVTRSDVDGDKKSDVAVYRPTNGYWYIRNSGNSYAVGAGPWIFQWGGAQDVPLQGDFDGDGKLDPAFYRPATGEWFIRASVWGYDTTRAWYLQWGTANDVPITADFDGDRKADITVYRPSTGQWFVLYSSQSYNKSASGYFQWGAAGDVPKAADYDGDGKADVATFRASNGGWYLLYSGNGYNTGQSGFYQWGAAGDLAFAGDYDGDSAADIVVYRPTTGQWFIRYSWQKFDATKFGYFQWGASGDNPRVADFDGDNKADIAVYRPSSGQWFIRYSGKAYDAAQFGYFEWGATGDQPLPN